MASPKTNKRMLINRSDSLQTISLNQLFTIEEGLAPIVLQHLGMMELFNTYRTCRQMKHRIANLFIPLGADFINNHTTAPPENGMGCYGDYKARLMSITQTVQTLNAVEPIYRYMLIEKLLALYHFFFVHYRGYATEKTLLPDDEYRLYGILGFYARIYWPDGLESYEKMTSRNTCVCENYDEVCRDVQERIGCHIASAYQFFDESDFALLRFTPLLKNNYHQLDTLFYSHNGKMVQCYGKECSIFHINSGDLGSCPIPQLFVDYYEIRTVLCNYRCTHHTDYLTNGTLRLKSTVGLRDKLDIDADFVEGLVDRLLLTL